MHVLDTYKFKMDQINSKREKVKSSIFRPYMLPWKPVVRSRQISNQSKLSCMISLPASMKRIRSRTAEKKWRHCFLIISLWGFLQTFKGSSLRSRWSNQTEIQTRPSSHACHRYLQLRKGTDEKQPRKSGDTVFPIITLSVTIETSVGI